MSSPLNLKLSTRHRLRFQARRAGKLEIRNLILIGSLVHFTYPVSSFKFDGFVKSLQSRHSREGGTPQVIDFPVFPPSRE